LQREKEELLAEIEREHREQEEEELKEREERVTRERSSSFSRMRTMSGSSDDFKPCSDWVSVRVTVRVRVREL
jgi:hypothetical protein